MSLFEFSKPPGKDGRNDTTASSLVVSVDGIELSMQDTPFGRGYRLVIEDSATILGVTERVNAKLAERFDPSWQIPGQACLFTMEPFSTLRDSLVVPAVVGTERLSSGEMHNKLAEYGLGEVSVPTLAVISSLVRLARWPSCPRDQIGTVDDPADVFRGGVAIARTGLGVSTSRYGPFWSRTLGPDGERVWAAGLFHAPAQGRK